MNQKSMQRALRKYLPVEFAEELNERVLERLKQLDAEREKYAHKALEKHFVENILPALALYFTLRESEDLPEDALTLTRKVAEVQGEIGRKRMAFLGRFAFFFWLLQKLTPGMMKNSFPPEGWDTEWLEVSKKRVAFNMHSCFYLDTLTKYGVPELTPIFCDLDDMIYEGVSPYLRWQRAGTLGRGDTHCDFRFVNPNAE